MATWASPEAQASHEKYVKTYNKWLKDTYPDKYGSWMNKGPKRRFVKTWGGRIGSWGLVYEGLKEVFNTGDIPTSLEERELHRANTVNQFVIDTTPKITYNEEGLAVGFDAPKGTDVDLSKYLPYQAMKSEPVTEPSIPTDGEQMEWIDPMDEWWPKEETVYDKERRMTQYGYVEKQKSSLPVAIFNKAKGVYEGIKYVTPPEIRQKLAESTSFISGGAYKLNK